MSKHLLKNAVHTIAFLSLALSLSACSKFSSGKKISKPKSVKSKSLEHRKPRDNMFIQNGGYNKKSKINPFATGDSAKPMEAKPDDKKDQNVIYERDNDKAVDSQKNQSPVAYTMQKKGDKRSFLKAIGSVFASIFKPKVASMTEVASRSEVYRPIVNKMVIAGTYSPNHSNITEQGSAADEYLDDFSDTQQLINMEPLGQIDSTPIVKLKPMKNAVLKTAVFKKAKAKVYPSVKLDNLVVSNVVSNASDEVVLSNKRVEDSSSIAQKIYSNITDIVNVSKMLYGITSDQDVSDMEVEIPEIKDEDLKNKSGVSPVLKDIPPVPTQDSSDKA